MYYLQSWLFQLNNIFFTYQFQVTYLFYLILIFATLRIYNKYSLEILTNLAQSFISSMGEKSTSWQCTLFDLISMDKKSTLFQCIFLCNFNGKLMRLFTWKSWSFWCFFSDKFLIYQKLKSSERLSDLT